MAGLTAGEIAAIVVCGVLIVVFVSLVVYKLVFRIKQPPKDARLIERKLSVNPMLSSADRAESFRTRSSNPPNRSKDDAGADANAV